MIFFGREHGNDLMVFADDEGFALNKVVVDGDPAHVLHAGPPGSDRQAVGSGNLAVGIGSDGETACAEIGIGGELVEAGDAVFRDANDTGAGCGELVLILRKCVGFKIATTRVGRRVEVDDHRAFFQRGAQSEIEFFARLGSGGGKIGCAVSCFKSSEGGNAKRGGNRQAEEQVILHENLLLPNHNGERDVTAEAPSGLEDSRTAGHVVWGTQAGHAAITLNQSLGKITSSGRRPVSNPSGVRSLLP